MKDHEISLDIDEAKATQRNLGSKLQLHKSDAGIATGNWGCGAFGGDPEVKTVIQWLAASQLHTSSLATDC
ncbi:Poly(ADP-ribose) glycohydrolase 1 [Bienertia sinuspersici]